jgi:hypothetical protein
MYSNSTDWSLVQPLSQVTLFAIFNAHPPLLGCRGEKNCFCVFSILMFGKKAVCPDGLFVPTVFQESDFYLNSLIFVVSQEAMTSIFFCRIARMQATGIAMIAMIVFFMLYRNEQARMIQFLHRITREQAMITWYHKGASQCTLYCEGKRRQHSTIARMRGTVAMVWR